MSRRIYISGSGLRISKPGYDAAVAAEEDLILSTSRPLVMILDSGTFTMGSGTRITFVVDAGMAPFVSCFQEGGSILVPTSIAVDRYGFNAWPGQLTDGTTPALGRIMRWAAFMRSAG